MHRVDHRKALRAVIDELSERNVKLPSGKADIQRMQHVSCTVSPETIASGAVEIAERIESELQKFGGRVVSVEGQHPRSHMDMRVEYWDQFRLHIAIYDEMDPFTLTGSTRIVIFLAPEIGATEVPERGETCANCRVSSEKGGELECKRYPQVVPTTKRNWCGEHRSF